MPQALPTIFINRFKTISFISCLLFFPCIMHYQFNKLTSVFYASVLLLIINFVITLFKVVATLNNVITKFMINTTLNNVMTKFMINNMTDALTTDINLFCYDSKLSNCWFSLADT